MANNNNMLTFGVGFDWTQAVDQKKAQEALDRAQRIVTSQPLVITAQYNQGSLKDFERAYTTSIDAIRQRISDLNTFWNSLRFEEKFDKTTGKLIDKIYTKDFGTPESPHPISINPAKAEAEIAQLQTALKTYGQSLMEMNQNRQRAIEEELRAEKKLAEDMARYREEELRDIGKAMNMRIAMYNHAQQMHRQQVEAEARRLTELQQKYEQVFAGIKGYTSSAYGQEVAVTKQILKYNKLNEEIQKLTAQYEKYKALQAEAGGKGYEKEINDILERRAALQDKVAAITTTADEANAKRVKQKEIEERHDQKILALQERIKEVQARTVPTEATTQVERTTRAYQEQYAAVERIKAKIADVESKMATAKAANDQEKLNQLMREREALYAKQISGEEDLRQKLIAKNDAQKAFDDAKEEERKRLIEQQTKAYDTQAKKIDDLNRKIQSQKDARDAMQAPSKSLADIAQAYKAQKDVVDNLKISLLSVKASREAFDRSHTKDTEYTRAHIAAQEKERALTQQLADEEAKLTTRLEQKLAAERANAAQIEKDDALIRRQLASVDALALKIQEYQTAQLKVGTFSTEVERITTAYNNQSTSIQTLRREYENAVNARKAFSDADKKNPDGTANKAYIETLQKEEKLAKDLNQAEQQLLNTQQRRLELLRQIGLSGNMEQYGRTWSMGGMTDQTAIDAQIQKYNQLKQTIATLGVEYERIKALHSQAGSDITKDKNANDIIKQRIAARKELDQIARTADQAEAEMLKRQEALQNRILAKQRKRLDAFNQRRKAALEEWKALKLQENTISNIQRKLAVLNSQRSRTDFLGDPAKFKQLTDEIDRLQKALDKLTGKQERAKKAAESHTKGLEYQKGVIDRLVQRMAVYASFGALAGFAEKVREVTAQFELQRISLGAIIQDQTRANQLFSEIKQFALKSPIKILDLTKYTKQVAAYRIETDKLFDTTKRLADVSVGLGVDMQRLVLAFGQVKAATYLRASELRQFTEAGIPMLELLSQKFTQLEGQMVSTADVMKRISKRGVEFKDVEQVFKDMTDAGGMFYNMQEKQGNTLFGMWAKLGDAASLMYDEIGNTGVVNSGMKAIINVITEMMRNWRSLARELGLVVAGFIVYKLFIQKVVVDQTRLTMATKAAEVAQHRHNLAVTYGSKRLQIMTSWSAAAAAAQAKAAAATNLFTRSWYSLRAALLSNPFTVVLFAIALLIERLYTAYENTNKLQKELDNLKVEGAAEATKSAYNFERLAETAVNAANGSKTQRDALDELQRTYKDIIPLEQMTIENLVALDHNYKTLTDTIRAYVYQRNLQQQVDAIITDRMGTITRIEKELREQLKKGVEYQVGDAVHIKNLNIDDDQINRFFARIKSEAKTTTKDVKDIIKESVDDIFGYLSQEDRNILYALGYSKDAGITDGWFNTLNSVVTLQRKMDNEIKNTTDSMSSYTEKTKEAKAALDKISSSVQNATYKFSTGGAVDKTSFLGRQMEKNVEIKQMKEYLKEKLGGAWNDSMAEIVTNIDKNNAEIISALDFTKILEAAKETNDPALVKLVEAFQARYNEIVPSELLVQTVNARFSNLVHSLGKTMDDYNLLQMKNDEDMENYVKRLKDKRDEYEKQIKGLKSVIEMASKIGIFAKFIFGDTAEGLTKHLEGVEESTKVLYAWLNELPSFDKDKKTGTDPRIAEAQNVVSELEKMYNKMLELEKSMSKASAKGQIQQKYAGALAEISEWAKKVGVNLDGAFESEEKFLDALKRIKDYISKLPKSEKAQLDIEAKIGDVQFKALQKDIEDKLKKLSDEVARSKAAKDFFNNILSQSKDYDMAMDLTMAVYGDTGENYQEQIINQIKTAFGAGTDWEINVTPAIDLTTGAVNYNKLEQIMLESLKDENLEKYRAQMQKVIDDGRKFGAERAKQWAKDLAVQQAYAQKRVELARYTAERIREIETDPNLTAEAKATYTQLYVDREAKEAAKLEYEAFKDTPLYVAMFEDLENASTVSLEAMKRKLIELRSEWKNLDPKQLKEMQKRFAEIEDELAERSINPFAQLKKGQADIRKWQQDLKTLTAGMGLGADGQGISTMKELDAARVQKANELSAAQDTLNTQLAEEVQYKRELTDLQMQYDELLKGAVAPEDAEARAIGQAMQAKKEQIQVTSENVAKSTEQVDNLQQQNNQLDEQADYYKQIRERMKKAWNGADKIKDAVLDVADSAYEMAEAFGASEDALALFSEIKNAVMAIYDATKTVSQALITISETAVASVKAVESASIILAGISAALQVSTAIANLISGSKARAKERAIKKEQERIDQLTYSYEKLADATDSLFGSAYISNYNQRIKNLQAQQASYMKQAQLEREKGKKADKDKIKDYEESARDAADEIIKMQNEIAETLAGTDVASAARDFAGAWLDAYISFETTSDKIKEKFNEMIKNMIIESAMGQIVQAVLQPFYDKITAAAQSDDRLTAEEVVELAKQIPTYTNQITDGLQIFASQLESLGMDLSELGESSEFTGIAREIASASEESITGLAAMINTQNYYISNVPLILQEVQLIRQYLTGGTAYAPAAEQASTTDLLTLQNEYLAHLPAIHTNTEAIAERCERAAMACENIADNLGRVIKPRGFSSEYVVNIN